MSDNHDAAGEGGELVTEGGNIVVRCEVVTSSLGCFYLDDFVEDFGGLGSSCFLAVPEIFDCDVQRFYECGYFFGIVTSLFCKRAV